MARSVRFLAVLLLLLLPARLSAQVKPLPPWSDLLPSIEAADEVVLAKVVRTALLEPVGLRVTVDVTESFRGQLREKDRISYLSATQDRSQVGDVHLLLLGDPPKDGSHHVLRARVGSRMKDFEQRMAWFRDVVRLRPLKEKDRGPAYLRLYVQRLASQDAWIRDRALDELERLVAGRKQEVRGTLFPEQFERAMAKMPEGKDRKRAQALKDALNF